MRYRSLAEQAPHGPPETAPLFNFFGCGNPILDEDRAKLAAAAQAAIDKGIVTGLGTTSACL
ncbi:MAG TPA: hypothetical protein VLX09_00490 [Stellaceae bacterium]|nr:hypothetical protein [Stellaceae bacterium]